VQQKSTPDTLSSSPNPPPTTYDVPSYQAEAVANYFEYHNPPYKYYYGNSSFGANGGVYNRNGRGIPDVSANGDNIAVFLEGNFTINGGTSAATPIFASIITLVSSFIRLLDKKSC
jgi:tripeptidyl-peptidase-1